MVMELFQDPDNFNLANAIRATSDIPVEKLSTELKKLSEAIQDELFELINHDFVKFQEILRKACDVDLTALKNFRDSAVEIKRSNEESFTEFKTYYETLKTKYERVEYVKRKLELNVNLQKASSYFARFSLLKQKSISEISPFELEIACITYLWTSQFLAENSQTAEIDTQHLLYELSTFSEGLQVLLEEKIVSELKNGNRIDLLAKLCSKLNKLSILESCFKFVKVERQLNEMLQASVNKSNHGSLVEFPKFLDKVFSFLETLIQDWNPLIGSLYHDAGYKFLVRAALGPTLAWLQDSLSSIFIPSKLAEFKINFSAALAFVSRIESTFFRFEDEVVYFRAHSAWSAFMKKWALHQYFQLQLRQTVSPIEEILTKPLEIVNEPKLLEQTVHCLNALKQLWSPNSLITPLVPKVLKTSIQLTRRFMHFCREDASAFTNPATFSLCCLQKRFNLRQFNRLFRETVLPAMKNAIEPLEEGLCQQLANSLNGEIEEAIGDIESALLPGIEQIYERLLITAPTKQSLEQLSFKALLVVANSGFDYRAATQDALSATLQRILIKVNRAVFKLHDQLGPQSLSFFAARMVDLESEAAQLGRDGLATEEFWIEIRQTITSQ